MAFFPPEVPGYVIKQEGSFNKNADVKQLQLSKRLSTGGREKQNVVTFFNLMKSSRRKIDSPPWPSKTNLQFLLTYWVSLLVPPSYAYIGYPNDLICLLFLLVF